MWTLITFFFLWGQVFVEYVRDLTKDGVKVLLTYDVYRARISVKVLRLFRENVLIAYALPSHKIGKLQPLDVTVFSSLKAHLRKKRRTAERFMGRDAWIFSIFVQHLVTRAVFR